MPTADLLHRFSPIPAPYQTDFSGSFIHHHDETLREALTTMPGLQRARLALFCNRRAHLHEMGLSIAATCSEADLVHEGGPVGAMLFRQSRDVGQSREHNPQFRRKPISLATLAPPIAIHESDEDEVVEAEDGGRTLVAEMEESDMCPL